jgi:hypothetical protein
MLNLEDNSITQPPYKYSIILGYALTFVKHNGGNLSQIIFSGQLKKMRVVFDNPIKYYLEQDTSVLLNDYVGKSIRLEFQNRIECISCKKHIKKSYHQGYCFPCTQKLAACDFCVLSPDKCHYGNGTCRDPSWADDNCMIQHYLYLANTSGVKVGLTKHTQIPTRWIDQGAVQALKFLKTTSRYQAGMIEKVFSKTLSDRTAWQSMLKKEISTINLHEILDEMFIKHKSDLHKISREFSEPFEILHDEQVVNINYPYITEPIKIKSVKLDNESIISGRLQGIKGQYLLFEDKVINIRSHTGYFVKIEAI